MGYLSDESEFIRELAKRWPEIATGGVIVLAWLTYEKITGRPVSMRVFVAILATALFFAAFGAWRDQYLKSLSSLTMSILEYRLDPLSKELYAKVQFANKGSIRRTILGVIFTCRSK